MIKWRLMLTTLPYVAAVFGLKVGLEHFFGFAGVVEFSEVGIVLTAGVFLTGFMLAGTMADYKESEKLPAELACTLETLEELMVQATVLKPNIALKPLRHAMADLVAALKAWLVKSAAQEAAFDALSRMHGVLQPLERDGAGGHASKALSELHNLRKTVTRIGVIARTGLLPPAYALLETPMGIIVVLVVAAKFKTSLAEISWCPS